VERARVLLALGRPREAWLDLEDAERLALSVATLRGWAKRVPAAARALTDPRALRGQVEAQLEVAVVASDGCNLGELVLSTNTDPDGTMSMTPLHTARSGAVVAALLAAGADAEAMSASLATPLHFAADAEAV
jgi:hypothetical protein